MFDGGWSVDGQHIAGQVLWRELPVIPETEHSMHAVCGFSQYAGNDRQRNMCTAAEFDSNGLAGGSPLESPGFIACFGRLAVGVADARPVDAGGSSTFAV